MPWIPRGSTDERERILMERKGKDFNGEKGNFFIMNMRGGGRLYIYVWFTRKLIDLFILIILQQVS